jgi:DNA modification methylase
MDGWHFLPCHEYVFWLTKGELRERNLGSAKMWTSIWRVNAPQGDYAPWHPAPFPVALASRCIVAMSNPGDLVLDPYSGAASTGVAALQSERRYLGFERVPEYIAKSQERLSSYQRPLIIHNRLDGAA